MARAKLPLSSLEALASSAVRTAHKLSACRSLSVARGSSPAAAAAAPSADSTHAATLLPLAPYPLRADAALIVVFTRGGSTARLVSKYAPAAPVLAVAVPHLSVVARSNLAWACSGEAPARHALLSRGLVPVLATGSARSTDGDTTDALLGAALALARRRGLCAGGDTVVVLHRLGAHIVLKVAVMP